MNQTVLRKPRVAIALAFFALTALVLLDLRALMPAPLREAVLYLQFAPSLFAFIHGVGLAAAGFIVVLVLTLLFGRVFCSTVCPLGTLQDGVIRLSNRLKPSAKAVRFRYKKPHNVLRFGLLSLTALALLGGSSLLVNLLDPFSNFGRIVVDLARPAVIAATNLTIHGLESVDIYIAHPLHWKVSSWIVLAFPLVFVGGLVVLSARQGRLYCNTVCPVGALLGLVSRFALFKIKINGEQCTSCAQCSIHCKAQCIHLKTKEVDFTRCVACFDCIGVCPGAGIGYKLDVGPRAPARLDPDRRAFVNKTAAYVVGATGLAQLARAHGALPAALAPREPISPPGSQGVARFTQACTACHLCVSVCPTQVLQPAFLDYGLTGLLQPRMDYQTGFCNFDCTLCGEVCPTGAILPLTQAAKQAVQLGTAHFLEDLCIVKTDKTACGACAEPCPTKAVRMVPYEGTLTIPKVDETLCVGCGACENVCPVQPEKAIYVAGHAVHAVAKKPESTEIKLEKRVDFPF